MNASTKPAGMCSLALVTWLIQARMYVCVHGTSKRARSLARSFSLFLSVSLSVSLSFYLYMCVYVCVCLSVFVRAWVS